MGASTGRREIEAYHYDCFDKGIRAEVAKLAKNHDDHPGPPHRLRDSDSDTKKDDARVSVRTDLR